MYSDDRLTRTLKILAIFALSVALIAVVGWFLAKIHVVVIVLVAAVFFAYLIYPVVRRLQRRLPRWLSIVIVYAVLAAGLSGVFAILGPRVNTEARNLAHDFPGLLAQIRIDILSGNSGIIASVPVEARTVVVNALDQAGTSLQSAAVMIAGQAFRILLSVASIVTGLVIVPVLAFYILLDVDRVSKGFMRLIPPRFQPQVLSAVTDIDSVLGGFIRGQVIVGAIIAIVTTIILLALHINYAFLIGLFAGVMDIIPYVGAIAGAVPAVLIALVTFGLGRAVIVVLAFVAMYQLEGHIIAPNVVGQRVGLTPLMVIVAILIGAELGGIPGMFISVPLAAIMRAMWLRFVEPSIEEAVEAEQI